MTPQQTTTARLLTIRHTQVVESKGPLHLEWEATGSSAAKFRVRHDGELLFETEEPDTASEFFHNRQT